MKMNNVELGSMAGAATSISAGATAAITVNEWAVVIGIVTALLTLALNVWCSRRRDAREQRQAELAEMESKARLAALGVKL